MTPTQAGGGDAPRADGAFASSEEEALVGVAVVPAVLSDEADEGEGNVECGAEYAATFVEEIDSNHHTARSSAEGSSGPPGASSEHEPIRARDKASVRWSDIAETAHANSIETPRHGMNSNSSTGNTPEHSPSSSTHPTKRNQRRIGLVRPRCQYGMDAVGEHVASIRSWVELVHRMSPATVISSQVISVGIGRVQNFLSPTRLSLGWRLRKSREALAADGTDTGDSADEGGLPNREGEQQPQERDDAVRDNVFPTGVAVHPSLTVALDGLADCMNEAARRHDDDEYQISELHRIVEAVARIPSFVKTVLLIEDENERRAVLAKPALRRVLFCPYSVLSPWATLPAVTMDDEDDEYLSGRGGRLRRLRNKKHRDESLSQSTGLPIHYTDKSWLLEMLKTGQQHLTGLAVDYLIMISDLTLEDFMSIRRKDRGDINAFGGTSISGAPCTTSKDDEEEFMAERDRLFDTVANLRLIITHIFTLPESNIERVAVTQVIKRALDSVISSPFSFGILFFDLIFHLLLLFSTRFWTFAVLFIVEGDFDSFDSIIKNRLLSDILSDLGAISVLYFVYRLVAQLIAMSTISWKVFYANLFSFWQLLEISAIGMAAAVFLSLWSWSLSEKLPYERHIVVSAFTIGLLWFNFVGFLKVLNWKLATFILAIGNIITDIRLFLVLLLLIILAFGDMFYTLISADNETCSANFLGWWDLLNSTGIFENFTAVGVNSTFEELAASSVNESPFCEGRGYSYFSIYKVLVGDVQADEYESSPITMFLFVLMTFFIVIVSLNILIAIVDESYERSTMVSAQLFGRARVALVAKNSAIERLLHPSYSRNFTLSFCEFDRNFMRLFTISVAVLICVLLANIVTSVETELRDNVGLNSSLSVAIACIFGIPMFYMLAIMLSYLFTGWKWRQTRWWFSWFQHNPLVKYCFVVPISFFMGILLGTRKKYKKGEQEWRGRLNHVESTILRISTESESRMRETIATLERRLEQSEAERKRDLAALENRINQLEERAKAERRAELADMERRIVQAFLEAQTGSNTTKT